LKFQIGNRYHNSLPAAAAGIAIMAVAAAGSMSARPLSRVRDELALIRTSVGLVPSTTQYKIVCGLSFLGYLNIRTSNPYLLRQASPLLAPLARLEAFDTARRCSNMGAGPN
jgi:hypothetical protein